MSAHNSFLRLNSTGGSQPGSPTASAAAREIKALQAELLVKESDPNSPGSAAKPKSWTASAWQFLLSNPKLRSGITHVGLVLILAGYTAAGASIFQWLEQPNELEQAAILQSRVVESRQQLIHLWEDAHSRQELDQSALDDKLAVYEDALSEAINSKVPLQAGVVPTQWTYTQSVFFASTVLTTIGYGNIAPATASGRVFCIFFALIGIPFTLTVIADLGVLMATCVSILYRRFRKRTAWSNSQAAQRFGKKYGKTLTVVLVLLLLIVYIAIGGAIFMIWEDWNFLESFYFCFITMTTIGFGDLVPGLSLWVSPSPEATPIHHAQTTYMLVCTIYILIGLALTTSIIELIRRQYAQSWKKMQELSNRLQGLTGPLADALRRISEQASKLDADGKLDPALLKELADLKMALTAVNAEMRRPSVVQLLQSTGGGVVDALPSRFSDEDFSSEDSSDTWPMEWDECWEERWAAIEEMLSHKAFKDKVMRILSQTSIKV